MSQLPISARRYAPVVLNGIPQWVRDQITLQADIVQLLKRDGALPKKRIFVTLGTAQATVESALAVLLQDGRVERYRAMSGRRRMDEHWCVASTAPVRPAVIGRYNAIEILAAMQAYAAAIHAGSANK
jgi:predicted transcriptional regulator